MPQHLGEDEAHLGIRQRAADAVARAEAKGREGRFVVVFRGGGVEPALREEGVGGVEVLGGGLHCDVVGVDDCLDCCCVG